jgi:hypothetical protein
MVTKVYDDGTILWYDEKLKNVVVSSQQQTITGNLIGDFVKIEVTKAEPLKLFWKLV